jgi:hypothetical protein
MRVIFLDCDGVLNSQDFFRSQLYRRSGEQGFGLSFGAEQLDPRALALLDGLVERADAKIVISSSWRHIWSPEEIGAMFEARGFKHKDAIIGETPKIASPMYAQPGSEDSRGNEVAEWLDLEAERRRVDPDQESVEAYVIVDDTDEFAGEQRSHFVRTNPQHGLTQADTQRMYAILMAGAR